MTDDLQRIETKAALSVAETGEITGIAWPFGTIDLVGDAILPGAFDRPGSLPMLAEHDSAQTIGVWSEITETEEGLAVKGKLLIHDVPRAREVADLIRTGEIGGLSIGFVTQSAQRHQKGRNITRLSLREISVVRQPCNPQAAVRTLKSVIPVLQENPSVENEDPAITATTPANNAPVLDTKALNAVLSRLDKLEAKGNRPGAPAIVQGDVDDERKSFVDYVRTGRFEVKTLAVGTPSTGGILAPEAVSTNIIEKIAEQSPLRSLSSVIQMGGPLLKLPRLVNEVSPGSVPEIGPRPTSEPSFEQISIEPHEMAVMVPLSRQLLEDSQVDLSSYLSNHIARRFGQQESTWLVKGNGTTQAEGVMTSAEVAEMEVEALDADALIDLFYSIKSDYAKNGAWLMNRATMATVRKLKSTDGDYLWQGGITAGQPATILGRPVYEAVDLPAPASGETPIAFGDFATAYTVADRVGFQILRDDYTGADQGIIKLHARRRVGGRVVLGEAITKLKMAA